MKYHLDNKEPRFAWLFLRVLMILEKYYLPVVRLCVIISASKKDSGSG
jgi:hypothetical protein